jgi:FAD/FMN-containing dehydrogenase
MNTFPPMQHERLFVPFLDEVDGTLCLPANATAADIHSQARAQRLRFPLLLDEAKPLREQIAATTHAPASCRFGPYCDNILGMNWRLPSGRLARIGERVVKTTTGYDWLRFLLNSGSRYGEPLDYVLRLRPDCGFTAIARFDGSTKALRSCESKLLHSGWMHWWDAVDYVTEGRASFVRVMIHCVPEEAPIFAQQLELVAASTSTQLTLENNVPPPLDGLPDLVIKTTPDRVIGLSAELAHAARRCVALCYSGVVHVYMNESEDLTERTQALIQPYTAELHTLGGDWHSRWLPATPPTITESAWLNTLEEAIHATEGEWSDGVLE